MHHRVGIWLATFRTIANEYSVGALPSIRRSISAFPWVLSALAFYKLGTGYIAVSLNSTGAAGVGVAVFFVVFFFKNRIGCPLAPPV